VTRFLGNGFISEAVAALSEYALEALQANRVFLTMDERNFASRRLAERVGFEYEGTLRNDRGSVGGGLRNSRIYSMIGRGEVE